MDILYYEGNDNKNLTAINLDNVKIIECKNIKADSNSNYEKDECVGLYMDNILIHHFSKNEIIEMYNETIKSDEKIKELYNLYCQKLISDEVHRQFIINIGFEEFKGYLKNKRLSNREIYERFVDFGVEKYIEIIKGDRWFINRKKITYRLLAVIIGEYYEGQIQHLVWKAND